jgi:hypothetical protein
LRTNSAGDRYQEEAIEKTILRILGSCTFLHSLVPKPTFAPPEIRQHRRSDGPAARGHSGAVWLRFAIATPGHVAES